MTEESMKKEKAALHCRILIQKKKTMMNQVAVTKSGIIPVDCD